MKQDENIEDVKNESADIHELFMLDIMREGMENGDTRLFR